MPERDSHGMDCSAEPDHAPHPPAEITSPGKAERPIPGPLIPGTRRFAAPSAASASVAAPPSRTRGASDSVLHQRSGRQASVSPRATADTRAAMTAESTAVRNQQTPEGAGPALSGSAASGPRDGQIAVARQKAGGRLCAIRADLPGPCQRHRRCVRPQIPGLSPGGLGPHLTSSGSPAGFPPVSRLPAGSLPFARLLLVSLRPAFSGLVPSAVARFRFPFGFPPGSLLRATLTLALPRGDSAGVGPGRQGPRSPVPPRPLAWIARSARTTYMSSIRRRLAPRPCRCRVDHPVH